jgi:hypothetical protein
MWFFLFFGLIRFVSAQLTSFPHFPLSAASSLPDIVTQPHRVMLPFHWAKMSALSLLHLSATLFPVAFPLEAKLKYWIHTTVAGYPPRTARLPIFTAIKNYLNLDHSSHHSIISLFYLLPSQSTTSSKLHPSLSFHFTDVLCTSSLQTTTRTVIN